MIKTLYRSRAGLKLILSMIVSRTSSMPVCEAASISSTSIERLSDISRHEGQASGASGAGGVAVVRPVGHGQNVASIARLRPGVIDGSTPNQAWKAGRAWFSSSPRPLTTTWPLALAAASSGVIGGV